MQKSKQKYHISMEKYNIKKGLIVYTCIVLVFGGCIQAINDKYIKEQLTLLFVDLLLIEAFLAVTFSVQFFRDGYIIRHDEIVFFHKFKKNRKKLKEIEAVVISNAYIYFHGTNPINMWKNGKIIPCPWFATVYKGNIIKNLIMDCQSYTKYRPNETTGGIFVSWRRKEELPTGA